MELSEWDAHLKRLTDRNEELEVRRWAGEDITAEWAEFEMDVAAVSEGMRHDLRATKRRLWEINAERVRLLRRPSTWMYVRDTPDGPSEIAG